MRSRRRLPSRSCSYSAALTPSTPIRLAVPQRCTRYFRSPADECAAEAWSWSPGNSGRDLAEETTGPPKFLENPNHPFAHGPSTPAGLLAPDH